MDSKLLQYMSKYIRQLTKLIGLGKELSSEYLISERRANYAAEDYQGIDYDTYFEPLSYSDLALKSLKWRTQCRSLLHLLPIQNTVYKELLDLLAESSKNKRFSGIQLQEITIKLDALLEDYQDGLLDSMILTIEGESSLNYVEQAKEFFDQEYYGAAGLIAVSALEGFLKSISKSMLEESINDGIKGISNAEEKEDKTVLTKLANQLKCQNYIDKKTASKIREWAKLRNKLAHGDLNISKDLVRELIIEIDNFISSRISHI
ncbi:HepT-like ribonuclease domain-containing protein [Pseudanabaena sp. 'Roaring Creek']|uniref:HepT-like ribonuclease domain-containing protein n=1 Tax=Pseudanabaena sp. 'Roaring Creek' TaxID=1681830 RepID=UPI0006D8212C|nr:HepT-like ribonuclease domain-containing protein [Pseudanabaena sp. 'Roaring Creek']